jgi:hypothetical protein
MKTEIHLLKPDNSPVSNTQMPKLGHIILIHSSASMILWKMQTDCSKRRLNDPYTIMFKVYTHSVEASILLTAESSFPGTSGQLWRKYSFHGYPPINPIKNPSRLLHFEKDFESLLFCAKSCESFSKSFHVSGHKINRT